MLLRRFVFPSSYDFADLSTSPKERIIDPEEPIHILMVAIKADQTSSTDDELSTKFLDFCQHKVIVVHLTPPSPS